MPKLLVVLGDNNLKELKQLATIRWESPVLPEVIVEARAEDVERIKRLRNVISVEEPKIGAYMV